MHRYQGYRDKQKLHHLDYPEVCPAELDTEQMKYTIAIVESAMKEKNRALQKEILLRALAPYIFT